MKREDLKQMIIDHFKDNPHTSAKPLIKAGDDLGAGVRGQIAGLISVLRDSKILVVSGGTNSDVHLRVDETMRWKDDH